MTARTRTDLIVFHCSATKPSQNIGRKEIEEWHLSRGFASIGYHLVIRRDGTVEQGRALDQIGAHVEGYNSASVGVCLVGGLNEDGSGVEFGSFDDTDYTRAQWAAAHDIVNFLRRVYPAARIVGHRDLSPDLNNDGKIQQREWMKTCPGFDAAMVF